MSGDEIKATEFIKQCVKESEQELKQNITDPGLLRIRRYTERVIAQQNKTNQSEKNREQLKKILEIAGYDDVREMERDGILRTLKQLSHKELLTYIEEKLCFIGDFNMDFWCIYIDWKEN